MKAPGIAAIIFVGLASAGSGWFANDVHTRAECDYTARGYGRLASNLRDLAEYPLQKVGEGVIGSIQRCWAAHPYAGPQHALELTEARKAPRGGYYVVFEPLGISDVQVVFRVQDDGKVAEAFQYGTL